MNELDALTIEADEALHDIDRLLGTCVEDNKEILYNKNDELRQKNTPTVRTRRNLKNNNLISNENLTNVFTLSDKMEPLRVRNFYYFFLKVKILILILFFADVFLAFLDFIKS